MYARSVVLVHIRVPGGGLLRKGKMGTEEKMASHDVRIEHIMQAWMRACEGRRVNREYGLYGWIVEREKGKKTEIHRILFHAVKFISAVSRRGRSGG
jgi:hypothetical protein